MTYLGSPETLICCRWYGRRQVVRRSQGSSSDLGAPHRRTTDILLAINVACYAAQARKEDGIALSPFSKSRGSICTKFQVLKSENSDPH